MFLPLSGVCVCLWLCVWTSEFIYHFTKIRKKGTHENIMALSGWGNLFVTYDDSIGVHPKSLGGYLRKATSDLGFKGCKNMEKKGWMLEVGGYFRGNKTVLYNIEIRACRFWKNAWFKEAWLQGSVCVEVAKLNEL